MESILIFPVMLLLAILAMSENVAGNTRIAVEGFSMAGVFALSPLIHWSVRLVLPN